MSEDDTLVVITALLEREKSGGEAKSGKKNQGTSSRKALVSRAEDELVGYRCTTGSSSRNWLGGAIRLIVWSVCGGVPS